MSPARLPPLVLVPRQSRHASQAERRAGWIFALLMGGAIFGVGYFALANLYQFDDKAISNLFRQMAQGWHEVPARLVAEVFAVLVLGGAHLWYVRRRAGLERVFLDETGMRYQTPAPGIFRSLQPSWSLQWSQLRELRIAVPKAMYHPNLVFLEFDAGPVKKNLQALTWVAEDPEAQAPEEPLSWRDRVFAGSGSARERERTLRAVEQSAIVRYARQAGVKVSTAALGRTGFALESNRHTLAAAVLGIALLVYGILDIAVYDESYAVGPPFVMFALGGAIAMLAGLLWLASAGAPRAETLGLALLLGGATGIALYSGALRLNEATDSEGLRAYDYRLRAYSVFAPVDPRLPELDFSDYNDYWGQFKVGTIHQFELRKGGLGFYQVNMAPVRARMREYFIGKR